MTQAITLFLVDDDVDDIVLFQEVITEVNPDISFESASNGQELLEKLKVPGASLPDLIFLDLNMPRMDGKECLFHLKSDERLKTIPVIMYTTSSQSRDIEETMQRGAICFITKPSNIADLKNILSVIVGSLHDGLEKALRRLSNDATTFIVC